MAVWVNTLPKHSLANYILQTGPCSDAVSLEGSLGSRIPNTLPGDVDAAGSKPVTSEGPLSYSLLYLPDPEQRLAHKLLNNYGPN